MASRSTRSRGQMPKQQPEPQSRAKWTTSLTKILADLLVDQVHKGNKRKNSFGKKAWQCICNNFHKSTGLKWDKEQLKNRYSVLKKQFAITKSLLDDPDFTWDEPTGAIVAIDEAWNNYISEHPDAETVKSSGCPFYKQLCIIFLEQETNGKLAENDDGNQGPSPFPQPVPVSMLKEEEYSSESEEMTDMADDQERIQSTAASREGGRKRGRKGIDDVIANAIMEMAAASKLRATAIKQYNERFSITDCVKALDEIQVVDDQVYFAALNLFNKRSARETFLSLKVEKRPIWLCSKCSDLSGCS